MEAILWILRTGAGWRDLPQPFGPWQILYTSFRAWARTGLWQKLLAGLANRLRVLTAHDSREEAQERLDALAVIRRKGSGVGTPPPQWYDLEQRYQSKSGKIIGEGFREIARI